MICERCDKDHDGNVGSGRFCSKKCARARKLSSESKDKIRNSLKKFRENNPVKYSYCCDKCGQQYEVGKKLKKNRKPHCEQCKRKVANSIKNAKSLLDFSKRTVSKILKRAGVGCAICGYRKTACDIHHIVPKKDGGSNDIDNLIVVCPNHHREIHELKSWTVEELKEKSIKNTFIDWHTFYHPKIKEYCWSKAGNVKKVKTLVCKSIDGELTLIEK